MPLGSPVDETGLLLLEGSKLVLERDSGGRWRLDADRQHYRMAGQRVRLRGIRSGFDFVDVESLTPTADRSVTDQAHP